jgi:gluconate 2-dehydrogenase gamma chain
MDRRESLKALAVGTVATGVVLEACNNDNSNKDIQTNNNKKVPGKNAVESQGKDFDRMPEEHKHYEEVTSYTFFNDHEMQTIAVLADIIIPKDDVSGSATDAKVPDFIEFIVKDSPEHQTPMRGGLRWLDMQCFNRYGKTFADLDDKQRIEMVDEIAYPAKAKPGMAPGVAFFNLMRNLTATGFYTSEMGLKDVGYMGNTPNQWNGVPADVLKQYNLAYTDKEMKECASY